MTLFAAASAVVPAAVVPSSPAVAEPRIACSVRPLCLLIRDVTGGGAAADPVVDAAADVHTFEPKPSDVRAVVSADLLVLNGRGLEPWAAARTGGGVLELADDATPAEPGRELWNDPVVVGRFLPRLARAVCDRLGRAECAARDVAGRAARLAATLGDAHARFAEAASRSGRRSFLAVHPVWERFAGRYGLTQLAGLEECETNAATLRTLATLSSEVRGRGLRRAIVEPRRHDDALGEVLGDLGLSALEVDPVGAGAASYAAHLEDVYRGFAEALS